MAQVNSLVVPHCDGICTGCMQCTGIADALTFEWPSGYTETLWVYDRSIRCITVDVLSDAQIEALEEDRYYAELCEFYSSHEVVSQADDLLEDLMYEDAMRHQVRQLVKGYANLSTEERADLYWNHGVRNELDYECYLDVCYFG